MSEYGDYEEGRHHQNHHRHRREEERREEEDRREERREERQYEEYEGRNPYYDAPYAPQPLPYGYGAGPAEYPQFGNGGFPQAIQSEYQQPGYGGFPQAIQSEYQQPGYGGFPQAIQSGYQQPGYGGFLEAGFPPQPSPYGAEDSSYYSQERRRPEEPYVDYEAQVHKHKRNEHLGEVGALAAGAFALYEAHEVKVDPENAQRHRIEESLAGVGALGAGGYALYEHQQVKRDHRFEEESSYREEGRYVVPYSNQYNGGQDYRAEEDYQAEVRMHKKKEHGAELGALAAGAFALYEGHEVKVDPENAGRHRLEEGLAGASALGAGGYALYEHQQARHDYTRQEHGKKHHHGFFSY